MTLTVPASVIELYCNVVNGKIVQVDSYRPVVREFCVGGVNIEVAFHSPNRVLSDEEVCRMFDAMKASVEINHESH